MRLWRANISSSDKDHFQNQFLRVHLFFFLGMVGDMYSTSDHRLEQAVCPKKNGKYSLYPSLIKDPTPIENQVCIKDSFCEILKA